MPINAPPKTHANTIADIDTGTQSWFLWSCTPLTSARHSKRSLTSNHEVAVLVTSNNIASPECSDEWRTDLRINCRRSGNSPPLVLR